MKYNPQRHHRQSIRLKGYDYAQAGLYFITICCENRICRFGSVGNGEMILNEFGKIARDEWLKTPTLRPNTELHEFVIMPNHIHGIIRLGRGELNSPGNELNSPGNELNSPGNELNSPGSELNFPKLNSSKLNSSEIKGECDSPQPGVSKTPEIKGVFKTPEIKGVSKTPLRSPSQTVGAIVRGYKSAVTKQLGLLGFTEKLWQRNYWEHIIRNENEYERIGQYIIENPQKWENDKLNHGDGNKVLEPEMPYNSEPWMI